MSLARLISDSLADVPPARRRVDLDKEATRWAKNADALVAGPRVRRRVVLNIDTSEGLATRLYNADGYRPTAAIVIGFLSGLTGTGAQLVEKAGG